MSLIFSTFQLIIGEQLPKLELFDEVIEERYTIKDNTYKISVEKSDNRFIWIYVIYGGSLPYSKESIDAKTKEIITNPRKINQIELNQQLFCLYDFQDSVLYLSNMKKKIFFETYLEKKFSKDCKIKRFFKNPEEFIEQINKIDKISFTCKKNLFSLKSGLFEDVKDIFGLGQPEDFKIDINYSAKNRTEKFIEVFKSFLKKEQRQEIASLVCIGKDDKEIETMFDIGSFSQARTLNIKKDDNGLFDNNAVKQNLINQILKNNNV